ncbi:MAG: 2-phospho-L-lactate guanylyltransferase [Hyphomicrobiaceae bacterium]|jgi:2-phospho-L-lactate guanylyltransferase
MLDDMIGALTAATSVDRIVVVSSDESLLSHARERGAETINEGTPRGLNGAVTMAAAQLEDSGVKRLLTIPGDVPMLDPEEIDGMFATDPTIYQVVLAPSLSVTGTNALLTSPPTSIEFRFEGESLSAHRDACAERNARLLFLALGSFAIDIDTPGDLLSLSEESASATGRLVAAWRASGVAARLESDAARAS